MEIRGSLVMLNMGDEDGLVWVRALQYLEHTNQSMFEDVSFNHRFVLQAAITLLHQIIACPTNSVMIIEP